jgi:hypothetical protein
MARGLSKLTHAFPGEHYLVVRPLRDDLRRSVMETPRRGRRVRSRRRRAEKRRVDRRLNKQLTRDTHKGRARKTAPRQQSNRAPSTMKARNPGPERVFAAHRPPNFSKDAGLKLHRPRTLSPHHPYAYHVLPVQRIYHLIRH